MSEYKNGDIVFFASEWNDICEAKVICGYPTKKDLFKIHLKTVNNVKSGGICFCRKEDIYPSREECIKALQEKREKEFHVYCQEIPDTQSLIRFLFTHDIFGEDHDTAARKAGLYCAEKLGFDVAGL